MSTKQLNVGIIGAGRIGKVHAETLAFRLPEARTLAIADVNREAAQALAARCGIPTVAESSEEILANPEIEAVLICSSTDTHADLIVQAAQAGKHIFCEKPIAHSLAQIDRALAAVEQAGVKLQIGFNRRFDANFARVRQAVVSGEIGTPRLMHIISRDPAPPPISYVRVSGGMFLDMTIHDFDMARFLIGDEVEEIYTAGARDGGPGDRRGRRPGHGADCAALQQRRHRHDRQQPPGRLRLRPAGGDSGQRGKIATENCYPNQAVVSTGKKVRRDLPLNFFMDRYTESFATELRAFVEAVRENRPTPVTGIDGRIPVVMGLAARKSYDEHRPVRLEEITA